MKLHRNLLLAIINGLKEILLNHKQADVTVENILTSNKSWGARDRNFIAENIYDIVRYKRRYAYIAGAEPEGEADLWKILGIRLSMNGFSIDTVPEFVAADAGKIEEAKNIRKIWESIPDWLDELGEKELGERWGKEITALNTAAKLSIRINPLKTNKSIIKGLFKTDGIPFEETTLAPDALLITQRKNFRNYAAYKNGLFEVQDISSQLVAPMLEAQPGMTVIDGCAGAGGKTLHICALMNNKGKILAVDVNQAKIDELDRRAVRAGCDIVYASLPDKFKKFVLTQSVPFADRILLDVPCSGLGVLRRKPDAKWSMSVDGIEALKRTQAQILDEYSLYLKPRGILVYSTCSILPSENEKQIESFIKRNKGAFDLIEEKSISPADSEFDGFYMAKMRRVM